MDCPECNRLRKQYQSAKVQHLELDARLNAATSVEDFDALSFDSEAAKTIRSEMRQTLVAHEATHGERKPATD